MLREGTVRIADVRSSPLAVAATVLVVATAWVAWSHHVGRGWHDFALVGSRFVERSSSSAAIAGDRRHATTSDGYDGQFFLYLAQDPARARHYMDNPSYRYGRIAYPMVARALALGRQAWIPPMLVAVNVLAIALGTLALAAFLRRRGTDPWFALLFAAYPGLFVALLRDLSEALAYSLVACAVWAFDPARRERLAASAALFALATLTREGAAVFALAWAASLALDRRRRDALLFAAASLGPYLVWRIVLRLWLGDQGLPARVRPTWIPFQGIAHFWPTNVNGVQGTYSVLLPALLAAAVAIWALRRGVRDAALWALLANVLVFVVLLQQGSWAEYLASGRIATGVVLAFALALPALDRVLPPTRTWLWVPVALWFAPWFSLLPNALTK